MFKRILSLFMMMVMISAVGIPFAFAAGNSPIIRNEDGSIVVDMDKMVTLPDCEDIPSPQAYNGTGAAITKIELYDIGWMNENPDHFAVVLKVTGYGNCKAFFNGNPVVSSDIIGHFINYGYTADGFFWLYDCGPVPGPGTYRFNTTFKSTNYPTTLSYAEDFTFSLNQ